MKTCTKCNETKEITDFALNKRSKDGRHTQCKICRCKNEKDKYISGERTSRKYTYDKQLRTRYGMTINDYNQILLIQNNKCKICDVEKTLIVDHCHSTGLVRGLLCNACNTALGMCRDNIKILKSAIKYLEESHNGIGTDC